MVAGREVSPKDAANVERLLRYWLGPKGPVQRKFSGACLAITRRLGTTVAWLNWGAMCRRVWCTDFVSGFTFALPAHLPATLPESSRGTR